MYAAEGARYFHDMLASLFKAEGRPSPSSR
jgi:hypothetical protein